jgi:hypothetical protein
MGGLPREMLQIRVAAPQFGAQLRHTAWLTGSALKTWIKSGLSATGISAAGNSHSSSS